MKKRTRFLDPATIDLTLDAIAGLAQQRRAKVALIGGCALQLYGSDRFTADVDVATSAPLTDQPGKALSIGGRRFKVGRVTVDAVERSDVYAPLYTAASAAAQPHNGVPVRVATLPYLGAMKLAAGRGKDDQDLGFILAESEVDFDELQRVVRKYLGVYAAEELPGRRELARLERKNGKR
ncbi:MAG: hypothetical protein ACLP1X_12970 [Polyangiaceae bacterium]